ncbi:MAG: sugar ABC transporter permease [Eubacteriales bacterium]|nr:sugar ABC transporter permease [Eubacteriales bacterium]
MNNKVLRPNKGVFILLLGPGLIWYSFAVIAPMLSSLRYSFFSFQGVRIKDFVGLANYFELVTDPILWSSLKNNLVITALCVVGQIGIALIFAMLLNTHYVKFKNLHRAFIFFPGVLSAVIVGFIWTIMYSADYGLIDYFLRTMKLDALILPWLDDPRYVIFFVSIPIIWQYVGYYMVIILSGMSSINREVNEMAEIDGATGMKKMIYITIPLIKNTLMVCLMLCISGNMQVFDHIFVMTGGGPGTSSTVMAMYGYSKTFTQFRIDYGNTISVGILVISLVIILVTKGIVGGKKTDG